MLGNVTSKTGSDDKSHLRFWISLQASCRYLRWPVRRPSPRPGLASRNKPSTRRLGGRDLKPGTARWCQGRMFWSWKLGRVSSENSTDGRAKTHLAHFTEAPIL